MRAGLGRRAGAAAALLTALVVLAPAAPAGAEPVLTIVDPKANQVLDKATVTVRITAPADLLYRTKEISWSLGGKSGKVPCPNSECSATWTVELPTNGPKELTVSATTQALAGLLPGPTVQAEPRTFAVAAPAAKPVLDAPKVNDARNTELSWSRNTEPDMLYYAVFRKDPAGSKYLQVGGKIVQPASGAKVSYTDTTTSAFTGGEYSYQVVAVRKGGAADSEVPSEPSTARLATVPPPPTTTSTTTAPGTPQTTPSTAGPTTTVKPGTSAGVDLSGFLSSRSQPVTLPTITVPEPPDTGFKGTLPFGARPDDLEEGEAEAVLPGDRSSTSIISRISPGRPLVPVAGGLVLLLLAMHMRVLSHRIKAEPAGDLPIDHQPPPPPAPAPARVRTVAPTPKASAAPEPPPAPKAPLDDIDTDWTAEAGDPAIDEEWAPSNLLEPERRPGPGPALDPRAQPDPAPTFDPDAIEVFEVVSSTRRRLARSGAR